MIIPGMNRTLGKNQIICLLYITFCCFQHLDANLGSTMTTPSNILSANVNTMQATNTTEIGYNITESNTVSTVCNDYRWAAE